MDAETVPLEREWVEYWRQWVDISTDGTIVALPLRALIYRMDKANKIAYLIAGHSEAVSGTDAILTRRCLEALSWRVVEEADCRKTIPQLVEILRSVKGNIVVDENLVSKLEARFGQRRR